MKKRPGLITGLALASVAELRVGDDVLVKLSGGGVARKRVKDIKDIGDNEMTISFEECKP